MPDIQRVQIGAIPGAVLAVGSIGEPSNQGRMLGSAFAPGLIVEPSRTGGPWIPDKGWCVKYKKDGSACKAKPVKDTDMCIGHTRQAIRQGLISTEG